MASISAGFDVELATKDDLENGLNGLGRRLAPKPEDRSLRKTLAWSGRTAAAGGTLIDFGGPPSGCLWVPLWITVTGGDDHTAVANGQVAVYVGGEALVTPPLGMLLIPASTATSVPFNQQLGGKDTVYAHFGDSVFALVYGTAGDVAVSGVLRVREVHPSNVEELNFLE